MQAPPLLLPFLRSPLTGELLAWLFLHPDDEFAGVDLARRTGASAATVSREVDRFAAAGLVAERRTGNQRLVRANVDSIIARPLADLLAFTYGPLPVLSDLLASMANIDEAFIYGSWAARYRNEPGPVPRDIDVLVVGEADEDELHERARNAEARLGREVNIRRVSAERWRDDRQDPFLATVRARPMVAIARP